MIDYILPFVTTFFAQLLFVGLKSVQQLNVVKALYWWIAPTSMLMAVVEVYVVAQVAHRGWDLPLVIAVGMGGGVGSTVATYIHNHFSK